MAKGEERATFREGRIEIRLSAGRRGYKTIEKRLIAGDDWSMKCDITRGEGIEMEAPNSA